MSGIPFICNNPGASADPADVCPNRFCKVNAWLCLGCLRQNIFTMLDMFYYLGLEM